MIRAASFRFKTILAFLLYYSGILSALKWYILRRRAVVLMYHRVLDEDQIRRHYSSSGIVVSDKTFRKQIRFLVRSFKPLSIPDFTRTLISGSPFTGGECLITFDDGWRDNYTNAFSVLREFSCPAVIFLPVSFIGGDGNFPRERLGRYLNHLCVEHPVQYRNLLSAIGMKELSPDRSGDTEQNIFSLLSGIDRATVLICLDKVVAFLDDHGISVPLVCESDFLNWEHVHEMAGENIDFGSHGVSHRVLTELDKTEVVREVKESKVRVQQMLEQEITAFAYPNGNHDQDVVAAVKSSGYAIAFTTNRGFVEAGTNPFLVKRINIHEDMTFSTPMFLARLLGVL